MTCADELSRWQKYGYGCSEIVFHPLRFWPTRGPFTPLFRQFLWSTIAPHDKVGIGGYIASYYAISVSWFLSIFNFAFVGILGKARRWNKLTPGLDDAFCELTNKEHPCLT